MLMQWLMLVQAGSVGTPLCGCVLLEWAQSQYFDRFRSCSSRPWRPLVSSRSSRPCESSAIPWTAAGGLQEGTPAEQWAARAAHLLSRSRPLPCRRRRSRTPSEGGHLVLPADLLGAWDPAAIAVQRFFPRAEASALAPTHCFLCQGRQEAAARRHTGAGVRTRRPAGGGR